MLKGILVKGYIKYKPIHMNCVESTFYSLYPPGNYDIQSTSRYFSVDDFPVFLPFGGICDGSLEGTFGQALDRRKTDSTFRT